MSDERPKNKFAPADDDWLTPSKTPAPRKRGKIFTFYSFKGGVGRSMSMANIAVLIAASGKKVLIVDFDLEAPGLEHFYYDHDPGLQDKLRKKSGVIDLLQPEPPDWRDCRAEIEFEGGVYDALPGKPDEGYSSPRLDIMHSGKASRNHDLYTNQVQGLDWTRLYKEMDIGTRFAKLRAEWLAEYDFVFIDSRTGVTDIGDLCTVVLPDRLVMLFVTNFQNINGVGEMYERVLEEHAIQPIPRDKLKVLPVLSRDEFYSEDKLSREWRKRAADRLYPLFSDWLPESLEPLQAMQKIFVPYFAIWSFGEALPVVTNPEDILNPARINAAYSRISQLILADLSWGTLDKMADPAEAESTRAAQKEELERERQKLAKELEEERTRLLEQQAAEKDLAMKREAQQQVVAAKREKSLFRKVAFGAVGAVLAVALAGYLFVSNSLNAKSDQLVEELQAKLDTAESRLASLTLQCDSLTGDRDQARAQLAEAASTARLLASSATEACKPALEELIPIVAQNLERQNIRQLIEDYNAQGSCLYARPLLLGAKSAFIEIFTPLKGVDRAVALDNDFKQQFGYEANITVLPVTAAQCELIEWLARAGESRFAQGPTVEVQNAAPQSGEMVNVLFRDGSSQSLSRDIAFFLVDDDGVAFDMGSHLIPQQSGATAAASFAARLEDRSSSSVLLLAFTRSEGGPPELLKSPHTLDRLIAWLDADQQIRVGLGYLAIRQ